MTKIKNLLPLGSVVQLKDTDKKLMITGILMNNNGAQYDYISVMYPEGYIDAARMFVFNHEDISKVEFLGYMNSEFQMFRGSLAKELEKDSSQ
jgi:hypothetical protein